MDQFLIWCQHSGVYTHPDLTFDNEEESNWRVTCHSPFLDIGEILCSIPKSILFTAKNSSLPSSLASIISTLNVKNLDTLRLTLHLAHEISIKEKSQWWPYLNTLPGVGIRRSLKDELPIFWDSSSEKKKWLRGTEAERQVIRLRADLDMLESLYHLHFTTFFTLSTLYTAFHLVLTRAFEIDDYHGLGMVPIADLFNHRPGDLNHAQLESEPYVIGESEEDTVDLVVQHPFINSSRDVDGRSEIFNTYGPNLTSAQLLAKYGTMGLRLELHDGDDEQDDEDEDEDEMENENDKVIFDKFDIPSITSSTSKQELVDTEDLISKLSKLDLVDDENSVHTDAARRRSGEVSVAAAVEGDTYITYDGHLSPSLSAQIPSIESLLRLCERRLGKYYRPDLETEEILDILSEAKGTEDWCLVDAIQLSLNERLVVKAVVERCLDGDDVIEGGDS